jgi:CRP-like cAMP-binding protein
MTTPELLRTVTKLRPPFLEDLAPSDTGTILTAAKQLRFLANSVVTNQGHPATRLFMVLSGGARCFYLTQGGQKLHVHSYPPGEMFGGMAIVARDSEYVVSTEAVKDSDMLVWERASMREFVVRYPKLLDNALSIAADYLNVSIATQVALSCHTARQRLAEVLVNLASGVGRRVGGGIELMVRNEELATAANITPFTVSRLISEWQRTGMLAKSRGKVLLPSPERLLLQDV